MTNVVTVAISDELKAWLKQQSQKHGKRSMSSVIRELIETKMEAEKKSKK